MPTHATKVYNLVVVVVVVVYPVSGKKSEEKNVFFPFLCTFPKSFGFVPFPFLRLLCYSSFPGF